MKDPYHSTQMCITTRNCKRERKIMKLANLLNVQTLLLLQVLKKKSHQSQFKQSKPLISTTMMRILLPSNTLRTPLLSLRLTSTMTKKLKPTTHLKELSTLLILLIKNLQLLLHLKRLL
jgi:hypothetical protein